MAFLWSSTDGKEFYFSIASRITCVLEYSLAEKNNSVHIAREKKTKQNSLYIYGIISYYISAEKIIKIHIWKICVVFLAWASGWLFLCHGSAWYVSASLQGELKIDTMFWRAASLYHQFAKWLQRTKVQGSESSLA